MEKANCSVESVARIGPTSARRFGDNAALERGPRALVKQINERYVQRVCDGGSSLIPRCSDPAAWFELDAVAQQWIAGYPVLLLNMRFEDANCWMGTVTVSKRDRLLVEHRVSARHELIEFTRHLLLIGWHTARTARSALFLLGIPPIVAREIAKLTFYDIDRNALHRSGYLRPRWEAHGAFWAALLAAARDRDSDRWGELELHGLQLLGRDLLRASVDCPPHKTG